MNRIGRMTLAMLEVVFVGFAMSRRVASLKLFPISIYKRLDLRGIEECRRPALLPVEYAKGSDAVWHMDQRSSKRNHPLAVHLNDLVKTVVEVDHLRISRRLLRAHRLQESTPL